MDKPDHDCILHVPDLQFVRFCETEYGVNRGIFNTIDQWFFQQGYQHIVERRGTILKFLNTLSTYDRKGKIKFGMNGLTKTLNEFLSK